MKDLLTQSEIVRAIEEAHHCLPTLAANITTAFSNIRAKYREILQNIQADSVVSSYTIPFLTSRQLVQFLREIRNAGSVINSIQAFSQKLNQIESAITKQGERMKRFGLFVDIEMLSLYSEWRESIVEIKDKQPGIELYEAVDEVMKTVVDIFQTSFDKRAFNEYFSAVADYDQLQQWVSPWMRAYSSDEDFNPIDEALLSLPANDEINNPTHRIYSALSL